MRRIIERIPIKLRLSLGHALWMALIFSCTGVGLYKLVERNLYESVDAALVASANSLRSAREAIHYRSPFTQDFLRQFFGENYIRPYAQLVDLSGRISERPNDQRVSLPVTPVAAARAARGRETFETIYRPDGPPIRQITLPVMRKNQFTGELIQVGAPLDTTYATLRNIGFLLWVLLPFGLLMSVVFGYVLTAWSLRPVVTATARVANLSGDDLSSRLTVPRAKDEINNLARTFNRMLDRLEDAFKRLRRFAGDVSHELRTPLAVMRGEAEFALRRERTHEEYRSALQIIARESVHMSQIVEDLLLLARAQSKSLAMNWQEMNSVEFLEQLRTSVELLFEAKSVQLKIEDAFKSNFFTSVVYLQLALKNILLNAVKHSPAGAEVVLYVRAVGSDKIEFSVSDQGEGIAPEAIPFVFDAFYRADTARNRAAGGVGIGLSLAQALVQLHAGKIFVESQVGVGSTFRVVLPLTKPSALG